MHKDKHKVALLINSITSGGAERVVQTLAYYLSKCYEVHLVTLENNPFYEIHANAHSVNISSRTGKEGNISKFFVNIIHAVKLKKYLKSNNIQTVISNLYRSNYVNILSKLLGSKHTAIIVDHSLPFRLYSEGLSGRANIILIKLLYKYADAGISVSKRVYEELLSITHLPKQYHIINNPFDVKNIKMLADDAVDDYVFDERNKYIILVGRLNKIKNHKLVISALNKINNKNIFLLIIGNEENVNINSILLTANNKDNIVYLNQKTNPYKYIKKSDILILPSDSESFGNVIIESMICGTPVISTRCGGPEEIITDSVNGILIDTNDSDQLAQAIEKLVSDERLANQFIKNGYLTASRYDVNEITNKYRTLIEDIK